MKSGSNKRGSVMVFLASILITMITVSMVFVHAARSVCGASYSDAVIELAGRSVLAEYDRRLKDEYGLFAFCGTEDTVESGIRFYASGSFNKAYPGELAATGGMVTDIFRLKLQRVKADLAAYSLMDADMLENQIAEYMNYLLAQRGLEFVRSLWTKDAVVSDGAAGVDRELKNQAEINSLPSAGNASNGINVLSLVSDGAPSLKEILEGGTLNFKVNEYILSHFKYHVGGDKDKETFFCNEAEYILYGEFKDEDNLSRFRTDFFLLRAALNAAHILASPEKYDAVITLSETFGAASPVAFAVIVAGWAAAEAENDARLLLAGKNVAFIKTEATWALSLKAAVRARGVRDDDGEIVSVDAQPRKIKGYISPSSDAGLPYSDYLRLFLFLEKRETKLLRAMDLIQLNFRGSYYEEFLIKDHYTGFSLTAKVSGKIFEYEQKY